MKLCWLKTTFSPGETRARISMSMTSLLPLPRMMLAGLDAEVRGERLRAAGRRRSRGSGSPRGRPGWIASTTAGSGPFGVLVAGQLDDVVEAEFPLDLLDRACRGL